MNKKEKFRKCSNSDCKSSLWDNPLGNVLRVTDSRGQDLVIGFNYVQAVCVKCGRINYLESDLPEMIKDLFQESRTFANMTAREVNSHPYANLDSHTIKRMRRELKGTFELHIFDELVQINKEISWLASGKKKILEALAKKFNSTPELSLESVEIINRLINELLPDWFIMSKELKYGNKKDIEKLDKGERIDII